MAMDKIPFPVPTNKAWERSQRREFRERRNFYLWLTVLFVVIPIPYLIFTWVTSIHERELLTPDSFFMVSYADIYSEVERIAKEWDPQSELVEARFSIWPYVDEGRFIDADFLYNGADERPGLLISAGFRKETYSLVPYPRFAGHSSPVSVDVGEANPLPEDFIFQDSLLAFEHLFVELEPSMAQDYLDIDWPVVLVFSSDSIRSVWELCYSLENSGEDPRCVASSGLN